MTNLCVCVLSGFLLFRFSVSSFLASSLVEGFLVINPEEKSDLLLLLLLLLHSFLLLADVFSGALQSSYTFDLPSPLGSKSKQLRRGWEGF